LTEFILITVISILIYETLIFFSFKKIIIENLNTYKSFFKLLSNKSLDESKKEIYFLNISKLLFLTSVKLLFVLIILISFLLLVRFINPIYFEMFFQLENILKITIIIIIYNFLRNKLINERL
tara:strand:- start:380 stop:748 length:369 start_codon:yes stop_codon:yes gene_type:complete